MKRKIIGLIVWICLTILYCLNFADIGSSMGAKTNSVIEDYSQMMVEYGGTNTNLDNLGSAMADMSSYKMFDNLSDRFESDFSIIGVTTVIYVFVSILIYHLCFVKNN